MRPDHPGGAKALSLGELSTERHIVPGAPLIVHERVALLYRHHDFAPENTISCNDIRLIKSLVLRGSGVTLLSLLDVLDEVQRGQLAFIPLRSTLLRPLTGAVYCALASAFAARANGHSDAECGDRIHGDGQPSGPLRMVSHMPLIMRSPVSRSSRYRAVSCISFPWVISHRLRAFSTGHEPGRSAGLHTRAGRPQYSGLAENGAQHHCIFHRRAASRQYRGGAVRHRRQRDAAAPAAERFDIMDFNAVGSLRVEGGDQLLHRRRPAGKVAAEVSAQGVTILRQTRRKRHIKEKVEPAGGDRHQRDALPSPTKVVH